MHENANGTQILIQSKSQKGVSQLLICCSAWQHTATDQDGEFDWLSYHLQHIELLVDETAILFAWYHGATICTMDLTLSSPCGQVPIDNDAG